ncbi:hypothetical protein AVEN_104868-1 [Araneus ventricosus]|uniref:Uncharacterized protein n=1 Tax=Araneus ventricosus TaxID=182803 RepID=A0A4Y2INE3_ARAVE|nr:hypothetical protein AVEN_104868-1 [Araneus ventricosus]
MFSSSLHFAVIIYSGVSLLKHYADYKGFGSILPVASEYLSFGVGSVSFILMPGTGSLINDASSGMWDKVNEVINAEENSTLIQQRFLFVTGKETAMTIWKITSVKRSFIFSTLGAILTYCILLDNLISTGQCS